MRSASCSALKPVSLRITSPMTSLTTSSKRDMCAPFCFGPRSTKHSRFAEKSCGWPSPAAMRITFSTPVMPTRESDTWTVGDDAWTSGWAVSVVGCMAVPCRVQVRLHATCLDNRDPCAITHALGCQPPPPPCEGNHGSALRGTRRDRALGAPKPKRARGVGQWLGESQGSQNGREGLGEFEYQE